MNTRWESIVRTARQIDESFADGSTPDSTLVMSLARAVLEFQQHLAGIRREPLKVRAANVGNRPPAAGEPERSVA